jgi:hypothetical protein
MTPKTSRLVREIESRRAAKEQSAREWLARHTPRAAVEVQPEPAPIAVVPPPVSEVALPSSTEFTPQDFATLEHVAWIVKLGAEHATDAFLAALPQIFRVGTTINPKHKGTFAEFDAKIREQIAYRPDGAAHFADNLGQLVKQARAYQRTNRAGAGETELASAARDFERDGSRRVLDGTERFARAIGALPASAVIGFASAESETTTRIRATKLKQILAIRSRWTSWEIEFVDGRMTVKWANRFGGRGHLHLVDQPDLPTVSVTIGNDNARAA